MPYLILKRCQQFYEKILARQVPHTLINWRFLLPNQSWKVRMHRQVFLQAWAVFPRWVWALILIYSSCSWLLYYSWRQIHRNLRNHAQTVNERYHISTTQQCFGLMQAAYLHAIPAYAFYQFKLYLHPEKHWLDFVYTHELPHWHHTLAPQISAQSHQLLSDKYIFAKSLAQAGLATVKTQLFKRGEHANEVDLFTQQNCFLKPSIASGADGCLALQYNANLKFYQLRIEQTGEVLDLDSTIHYINKQIQQRDYILQPLLCNHPLIQQFAPTDKLVTLRLISACAKNQQAIVVSALLEIPAPDKNKHWWLIAVDCETGCFIDSSGYWLNAPSLFIQALQDMAKQAMPFWSDCVALCLQAHHMCPDVLSIGWDVAITPDGVQLLEGNFNWGIAQHQTSYNTPALNSALGKVYQSYCY